MRRSPAAARSNRNAPRRSKRRNPAATRTHDELGSRRAHGNAQRDERRGRSPTAADTGDEAGARASARAVVARAAAAEETKAAPADDAAARDETPRAISQALVYAVPEDYVADDAPEAVEAGGGGKVRKKMLGKLKKSAEGHSKKFVGEMRKMFFPT